MMMMMMRDSVEAICVGKEKTANAAQAKSLSCATAGGQGCNVYTVEGNRL